MFRGSNLFTALLIPVLIFLQITLIPLIAINNIAPDLLIVLIAYYTVRNGQFDGMIFAAIAGLLFDFLSGTLLGSMMLSKVLASFIIGYFYNELKTDEFIHSPVLFLLTFLGSLIDSLMTGLISSTTVATNGLTFILLHGFMPALYTSVFAGFVTAFHPKRTLVR